jgi:hypothetical protein
VKLSAAYFCSALFSVLALVPAGAHLLSLAHKIDLPPGEYLEAQQVYRGWALTGVVVVAALISTLSLVRLLRRHARSAFPALAAFICLVGTQVLFWVFTFPANRVTDNWTTLPAHWEMLRVRWEYSHAASAVLNLVAVIVLIAGALSYGRNDLPRVAATD